MQAKIAQILIALLLIVGLLGVSVGAASAADPARFGKPTGRPTTPTTWQARGVRAPLDAAEIEALQRAVLEEYGAINTYQAVIEQFGAVQPFSVIARSEQQHVNALLRQATKYGVAAPVNPGLAEAPQWGSIADACQTGVAAEIADAALYDELLKVTDNADLVQVYRNLQAASLNRHLPAFEACN